MGNIETELVGPAGKEEENQEGDQINQMKIMMDFSLMGHIYNEI